MIFYWKWGEAGGPESSLVHGILELSRFLLLDLWRGLQSAAWLVIYCVVNFKQVLRSQPFYWPLIFFVMWLSVALKGLWPLSISDEFSITFFTVHWKAKNQDDILPQNFKEGLGIFFDTCSAVLLIPEETPIFLFGVTFWSLANLIMHATCWTEN